MGLSVDSVTAYPGTNGRALHLTASIRSTAGVKEIYFVFPAAADQRTLQDEEFLILVRAGAYGGDANLSLEILAPDGTLQYTASSNSFDIDGEPAGASTSFSLSGTAADLLIEPGEFLVAHVQMRGAPTNDLDVKTALAIEVTP